MDKIIENKKNAKNLVFSDGNINAKIMIIGEGPGANEDFEGRPFVGRAGKLLDKMLAAIQLDREKVYISNVVNYRPPNNRKPTELEIERYLPYLINHIEIINPKIKFPIIFPYNNPSNIEDVNQMMMRDIIITIKPLNVRDDSENSLRLNSTSRKFINRPTRAIGCLNFLQTR